MEYAVVKFIDENAPGVVSINWINRRKGTCWFPNVRSEMKKNKLLMKGATPSTNWLECPIKVLKEFASYQNAKNYLDEVEENSKSESLIEFNSSRKRPKTAICVSDDDSGSEEDNNRKKSKNNPALKFHPHFFSDSSSKSKLAPNQYQVTFSLPVPTPMTALAESSETPGHSRGSADSEASDSKTASLNQDYLDIRNNQGIMSDIEQLKTNQTNMCNTLAEVLSVMKRLESKINVVLANSRELVLSGESDHSLDDMRLLTTIPVGLEDFGELNDKIVNNQFFKQRLSLILKSAGGRHVKALAVNILRKLITDDVGERYSLTGKQAKSSAKVGLTKQCFEKTALYKLILEICFSTFSEAKENAIREAISDWLMQSKFRKNRRKERMNTTTNVCVVQLCNSEVKDEHLGSDDDDDDD